MTRLYFGQWGLMLPYLCFMTWRKSLLFNCKYKPVVISVRQSTTSRQSVFITPWNFGSRKNTAFKKLVSKRIHEKMAPDTLPQPLLIWPTSCVGPYLSARGGKPFTILFKHTINLSSIVFWCCFSCFTTSSYIDSAITWKIKFLFKHTKVEHYVKRWNLNIF